MSVFASEILDLRSSPEYLAMGYFGRLGAENKIQVKLCKRTGASDVKFDLGYARVEIGKNMPPMPHFYSVKQKASSESRPRIQDLRNGFEIRNINGGSEFVSVRGLSNLLSKRTKLEYSLSCVNSGCYKSVIDMIAERIGLVNASE